jgi:hypothetical protein
MESLQGSLTRYGGLTPNQAIYVIAGEEEARTRTAATAVAHAVLKEVITEDLSQGDGKVDLLAVCTDKHPIQWHSEVMHYGRWRSVTNQAIAYEFVCGSARYSIVKKGRCLNTFEQTYSKDIPDLCAIGDRVRLTGKLKGSYNGATTLNYAKVVVVPKVEKEGTVPQIDTVESALAAGSTLPTVDHPRHRKVKANSILL